MDPNANLAEQLRLATSIIESAASDSATVNEFDAERLAELVLVLNDWITKGGFLPEKWTKR